MLDDSISCFRGGLFRNSILATDTETEPGCASRRPHFIFSTFKNFSLSSLLAELYIQAQAKAIIEKQSVFCNSLGPKGKWKAFPNGRLRQEMFYLLYSHKKKIFFNDPSNYATHTVVQVFTQEATTWDGVCVSLQKGNHSKAYHIYLFFTSSTVTRDRLPTLLSAWPVGVRRIFGLVPDVLQGKYVFEKATASVWSCASSPVRWRDDWTMSSSEFSASLHAHVFSIINWAPRS